MLQVWKSGEGYNEACISRHVFPQKRPAMRVWDLYVRHSDIMILAQLETVFTSLKLSPVENCESLNCSEPRTPASFPLTGNHWTGWWLRFSFQLKFLLFKVSLGVWNWELRLCFFVTGNPHFRALTTNHSSPLLRENTSQKSMTSFWHDSSSNQVSGLDVNARIVHGQWIKLDFHLF